MTTGVRILTPVGMLGYGYPINDFWAAVDRGVDAIVVDSGSTDPGPIMLGTGTLLVTEDSYARDLRPLLQAAGTRGIPLVISSAGGAGTNAQVDWMVELVDRISTEEGLALRVAAVYADIDPAVVLDQLDKGRIQPNILGDLPTHASVHDTTAIVAQMGAEPLVPLLTEDHPVDVVVAGRAYDPAPHAAFCLSRGIDPAIAWHMGKIMECGAMCAIPKSGGVVATVYPDAFELTPISAHQACTPLSVAAHTLYEKGRPDLLIGPSGVLDVRHCTYTAVDERTVRVQNSRFEPAGTATVKLEGASPVGYRSVFIGGIRDPLLIRQIEDFLDQVRVHVGVLQPDLANGEASLRFHVYGKNGTMGDWEPHGGVGHEVAILGEVTAPTQERATAVCTSARVAALHKSYPGQKATAGNLALPLTPLDIPIGPVFEFTLYHVMDSEGLRLFSTTTRKVGI